MKNYEFFVEEAYGSDYSPETRVACKCGSFAEGLYCRGHNLSEIEIDNMKMIARAKVDKLMHQAGEGGGEIEKEGK